MKEKLHIELTIPKDWNGKQAKVVWEFLSDILEAVWDVHGNEIDDVIEDEQRYILAAARGELKDPTDDYPF